MILIWIRDSCGIIYSQLYYWWVVAQICKTVTTSDIICNCGIKWCYTAHLGIEPTKLAPLITDCTLNKRSNQYLLIYIFPFCSLCCRKLQRMWGIFILLSWESKQACSESCVMRSLTDFLFQGPKQKFRASERSNFWLEIGC